MEVVSRDRSDPKLSVIELSPVLVPYFLGFFMYLGLFSNFPLYLQITQGLTDVETVEIWAIISGTALFIGGLSRIPAGIISDRIGRFNAFLLAYFVYFISMILVLTLSTNIIFILAMALIRFGTNIVAMSGRGIVSISIRDRGLKNGLLQSMAGFGSFIGPFILGYALDNYHPDYILFVALSVIILDLGLFVIFYKFIPRWLGSHQKVSDINYDPIKTVDVSPMDYLSVLNIPEVREVQVLFLATGLAMGLLQSIYSIYGYNILGIDLTTIGLITGLGSLAGTIASPIAGRLYSYFKDEYLRVATWSIMFLATFTISISSVFNVFFYSGLFIMNAGLSSYYTIEITRISRLVSTEKFSFTFGLASTLVILASAFAGFISPYLYNLSSEMNFYSSMVVCILALILTIWTAPKWIKKRFESDIIVPQKDSTTTDII